MATEQDRVIGARLRGMRDAQGLSQSDLGAVLGVTFQQIQKYEKGTNRISGSRLMTVCKALHTTPDVLLGVKASANNGKNKVEDMLELLDDPIIRRALRAIQLLPEKRRAGIVRIMMTLVDALT